MTITIEPIKEEQKEEGTTPYTKGEVNELLNTTTKKVNELFSSTAEKIERIVTKIDKTDNILLAVVVILLVMVATLIIDSFHINSAIYKEYSEKMSSIKDTQELNSELLKQNKENQELILTLLKNKK